MSETPFASTATSSRPEQVAAGELAPDAAGTDRPLTQRSFSALVVEDNMLIAMEAEEALRELGAAEVQLCPDVASALDRVAAAQFDVALLDVSLGDETSEPIATALRTRGTPFVITTGLGDYISDIAAYARAPVLTKPYAPADLSQALSEILD